MLVRLKKTDDEKVKIILESDKTSTELSREINIPPSTIRNIRSANGVFRKNKFINPPIDEFVKIYDELKSSRKVAEYYGTNHKTILEYAKSIGYKTQTTKLLTLDEENKIANSYFEKTAHELAQEYHVSESKIEQIWGEYNLKGKTRRIFYLNENYFNVIDTPAKAYFLGWIGADGCIHHPNDNRQDIIRMSLQHGDIKILELMKRELNYKKPISVIETTQGKYVSLDISSNIMSKDLNKIGFSYRKTYSNTIADIEETFMSHFIRGYFEGDGSFIYSKPNVSISGYEYNLLKIKKYLETKNIYSTFIEDKRQYTKTNTGRFGSLRLSNKTDVYCFLNLIYDNCGDFYLDRKYYKFKEFTKNIETSDKIKDKQIITYYKYAVQKVG